MKTFAYGYPRIGSKREFKKLLEGFWKGNISESELLQGMKKLEGKRIEKYSRYVDLCSGAEMSFYDRMLDMSIRLGIIPRRFGEYKGLDTYFEMARGKNALEMTKWFNTNYHYLVPEIESYEFYLNDKLNHDYLFSYNYSENVMPSIIGPFTFITLSKALRKVEGDIPIFEIERIEKKDQFHLIFSNMADVYIELLKKIKEKGYKEIVIEEPAFVTDMEDWQWNLVEDFYSRVENLINIYLLTYYDSVSNYRKYVDLPVKGISLDFVSNEENFKNLIKDGFPKDKVLIAGVINGRQVWRANLKEKAKFIDNLSKYANDIFITNSCPLFHIPVTVEVEDELPAGLKERLSFADEKLYEIRAIKGIIEGVSEYTEKAEEVFKLMTSSFGINEEVRIKVRNLSKEDFSREKPYEERESLQSNVLNLPPLPTTTIGSFPQTEEVRKMRSAYRTGKVSKQEYEEFITKEIKKLIDFQEKVGLDVFVHGEFERTDMVEFFAQKLDGIATTKHGWVISYGSRVYRPPIIYGDVSRPEPMTLKEILYAQSLTDKPVKGMLTGPVTILNWSFYRDDVPKEEIAYQIAFALQDEVKDLEREGIKIIQIDEPAFREGAPIKKRNWTSYFEWAIKAFRIASKAKPETQIHTHMCYSEFNEIIEYIYKMDFDVISIEASRSKGEIISAFNEFKDWNRQIGIGVYDIHSPTVPTKEEIKSIIGRVMKIFPPGLIWVNPDCGLKTRRWEEVEPALKNMVDATREAREHVAVS